MSQDTQHTLISTAEEIESNQEAAAFASKLYSDNDDSTVDIDLTFDTQRVLIATKLSELISETSRRHFVSQLQKHGDVCLAAGEAILNEGIIDTLQAAIDHGVFDTDEGSEE
ncbi:MAG: hypothetical protein CMN60_21250 [Sphingobium sp.]|nr:hypothetical protein [Sphingobium sp.]MBS50159.1 hypothetical protein [Sphingobium sp.]|tara:strand:+ start:294 stop:629 length:336 start_codon:yes stop_codon:yes gene_type:complete